VHLRLQRSELGQDTTQTEMVAPPVPQIQMI
jgi:hypothetical protein